MADISASMVMELRQRTGLGMMECKKALTETGGDLAKAEELLRIKSGAKATKAASRVAAEGIVGAWLAADGSTARWSRSIARPTSSRATRTSSPSRRRSRRLIGEKNPADVAAPPRCRSTAAAVESARQALVQKIGENVAIRRFARFATPARLMQYLHGGGRIGVTVELEGGDEADRPRHRDACRRIGGARRHAPGLRLARPGAGRAHRQGARDLHGAGRRQRQAGRHRRQDGRGPDQQVPRRGDAPRPAVRQEPRRIGREAPARPRAPPSRRSRSTSSARASRSARTTSPPRWRRWPRPDRPLPHCPSVQRRRRSMSPDLCRCGKRRRRRRRRSCPRTSASCSSSRARR